MIVAGIGARKAVEKDEIVALIDRALSEASLNRADLSALATVDAKADEPGLVAAATALGLDLLSLSADAMQRTNGGVTTSICSQRLFDVASVSEAAALAAAGEGSILVLARIKSARVTCALARSADGAAS